jgi:hypothetical protein
MRQSQQEHKPALQVALTVALVALLVLAIVDRGLGATERSAHPAGAKPAKAGERGPRGPVGRRGPSGVEGPIGKTGPAGPDAGPHRQFVTIDWQNGDYTGKDRQDFVAPGIGTGEVRCTPPNGSEPTGVQWIRFYPFDNGTKAAGPDDWNTTMWTSRVGGDVGDPDSARATVVRTARLDRPNQQSGFYESMNTIAEGTVQESIGTFTGLITTEPLRAGVTQPAPTSFRLTWYWKFNGGSPRCYMAGTFSTKGI